MLIKMQCKYIKSCNLYSGNIFINEVKLRMCEDVNIKSLPYMSKEQVCECYLSLERFDKFFNTIDSVIDELRNKNEKLIGELHKTKISEMHFANN